MRIPFSIGEKDFLIQPYTSAQEKDILLLSSFEVDDIDRVFDILNFKTEYDLNEVEKKLILYKHREVSLGDEINVNYKCECGYKNESTLTASNFIKPNIRDDKDVKRILKDVTDETLHEFVYDDVDELDIDEFDALKERVKQNQINVSFIKSCSCIKCKKKKDFDISATKYIIEVMSDETLMSLYKTYNQMIYFGHYTKNDIDNMYPFERSIFVGLLNKLKEDLNK